jgi:protein-tyrosine phosphatase
MSFYGEKLRKKTIVDSEDDKGWELCHKPVKDIFKEKEDVDSEETKMKWKDLYFELMNRPLMWLPMNDSNAKPEMVYDWKPSNVIEALEDDGVINEVVTCPTCGLMHMKGSMRYEV